MTAPSSELIAAPEGSRPVGAGRWARRAGVLARDPQALLAGAVLAALVVFCLVWPQLAPYGANDVDFEVSREGPSLGHPLGTDQFGRDLLTRLAVGGRTTLAIAFAALAIILAAGVVYGTVAGLAGGAVDALMMRIVDGLFAIPRLPVAIVILVVLSAHADSIPAMVLALSVAGWMLTARLVRGQMLALKTRDYVRASRALGARWAYVARRHLLPNSAGIILVAVLLELPTVVLGEAFLSVLGLGPPAPTATWGNVAEEGLHFFRVWQMGVASAAIAVFVLSANVLADRVHDALDPRRGDTRSRA